MVANRSDIGNEHIDRFLDDVKGFKSEGTWETRHSDLKNFHAWMKEENKDEITNLTALDIREYIRWNSNRGYAPATIMSRYNSIHSLYESLAGIYGVIEEHPMDDLKYKNVKGIMQGTKKTEGDSDDFIHITPEEVDLMVENAPRPKTRNQLMFRLLFQTGIRAQECRDIKIENVDTEKRAIEIYSEKERNENDSWRTVYYQPNLDTLMSLWLNQIRETNAPAEESEYLFVTNRSEKLGKSRIQEIVRKTAKEAGIQKELYVDPSGKTHHRITPHAFRHGHCMQAIKKGIDIAFVSEHAGHTTLDMTKRYLESIEDDVQDAYKSFGA